MTDHHRVGAMDRDMDTDSGDLIDAYLGDLSRRLALRVLRPSAADTERIVADAEDHLREAAAAGKAEGMTEEDAQRAAIVAFGPVVTVVRAHRPPVTAVLTTLATAALPLLGIFGLASAVMSVALTAWADYQIVPLGRGGTLAAAPGTTSVVQQSTAAQPSATQQWLDGLWPILARSAPWLIAAAVIGIMALAAHAVIRRRQRAGGRAVPLPGFAFPLAAACTLFLGSAMPAAVHLHLLSDYFPDPVVILGAFAAGAMLALGYALCSLAVLTRWTLRRTRTAQPVAA